MTIPNIVPELKAIINSVSGRENEGFQTSMEKLALKFVKSGSDGIAEKIRFEAEKYKQRLRFSTLTSLPINKGIEMASVYTPVECFQKSKRLVLSDFNQSIVNELICIFERVEEFIDQEVPMPNKLLMFGPPGTGKTVTAFKIAHSLDLPLLIVRLDTIIDSHMGETSVNVRKIFEYSKKSPCVLFLDEFDAVARSRGSSRDVKEMARVVNTLLQCLDEFNCASLVLAATNLDADLDPAIWRRFDTQMTFSLPNEVERERHLSLLIEKNLEFIPKMIEITINRSFAEIEQIVLKAKRKAIIERDGLKLIHLLNSYNELFPPVEQKLNLQGVKWTNNN